MPELIPVAPGTPEPVTAATCKIRAAHRPHGECQGTAPEFPWEHIVTPEPAPLGGGPDCECANCRTAYNGVAF